MANDTPTLPSPARGGGFREGVAPYFCSRGIGPLWRFTGAQNTASRNSSKSNTSAWAASTAKDTGGASSSMSYHGVHR